ncbi:MAG: thymidylate synthase [Candidatus Bathyarchaeota archaeon]|nr:thymidylate synthase [Candidatus Bathyarchaeota archaeon]
MIHLFSGKNANDIWLKIAAALFEKRDLTKQKSRAGVTTELMHVALSISQPLDRWIVSREKPLNPAFVLADIVWILTGRNDSAFLNYFNSQLPKFAGSGKVYHGAYGFRLRNHLGLDQLERAYQVLRSKPDSRQVVLQIWDGRIDLPDSEGNPASEDIPCNTISMLKVRDGALEWFQIMRSNDFYFGLPYNLVQFTVLQEVLAGWLGLRIDSYNHLSDSLHLYERDIENVFASKPIISEPNTDVLGIEKNESDRCFVELASVIEKIIDKSTTFQQLQSIVASSQLPPAYINILKILVSEGLRKRGRGEISQSIMADCNNPIYKQLYQRWIERIQARKQK